MRGHPAPDDIDRRCHGAGSAPAARRGTASGSFGDGSQALGDRRDAGSRQVRLAAYYAFADPTRDGISAHSENLRSLAAFVGRAEAAYVEMLDEVRVWLDASAGGGRGAMREILVGIPGRAMVAGLFASRARTVLDIVGQDPLAAFNALYIAEAFPVAIDFIVHRFRGILDGGKPSRQANSSWDAELALSIGQVCNSLDGSPLERSIPICLVTGDRALRDSATRCGLSERCNTLDDYHRQLRELDQTSGP